MTESKKTHQTQQSPSTNLFKLCDRLIKSESEIEVIKLLKQYGYWDNPENWKYYGDVENNFATIGNQQSLPESALVEKLINTVDAVFMRECYKEGIDPESEKAPQSIVEAQERYFKIRKGSLWDISTGKRTEIAQNIAFVASGEKRNPCYSIIDLGEGQTPKKMPDTFLSLARSNKMRIPFVQGKFNMGGTGVLQFSGTHNLQLIVSKRNPNSSYEKNDQTRDKWGFTIVRRENPSDNRKSSSYTYLVVNNKIPIFERESLRILPGKYPQLYKDEMKWGTYVKLYEYQIPGYRTNILLDLYNRICLLVPRIALPIRFYERRKGYSAHSYETTMAGLEVRLNEDKRGNLENGFPSSCSISILGEKMTCQIYAFKKGQSEKYRKDEGVIFSINGQTHGYLTKRFFSRKSVNLGYISNSILVSVDCSNIDGRTREDLFMNSRDRLREGDLKQEIENELELILKNHQGLNELKTRRRQEDLHAKLADSKPLQEIVDDLVKKSPSFASLLFPGTRVSNPFDLRKVKTQKNYIGKEYPTFFKIKQKGIKKCPINRRCIILFETDADNDYFERNAFPGDFKFFGVNGDISDYSLHLWNGLATLTFKLPYQSKVGSRYDYLTQVNDEMRFEPFENTFSVEVAKEIDDSTKIRKQKKKRKPPSEENGKEREKPLKLSLPNVIEVTSEEWDYYGFDQYTALLVKDSGGVEGYDFYINMDNSFLLTEIKANPNYEPKITSEKYQVGLILIGMALLFDQDKEKGKYHSENEPTIEEQIEQVTRLLSRILIPMITHLGELEIEGDSI